MPKINEKRKQENRALIIKTAKKLFYEHGYNRTSVNDIIDMARISKGKFYTYFDSKADLFFDIISDVDRKVINYGKDLCIMCSKNTALIAYIEHRLKRFVNEENRIRAKYTFEFWSSVTLNKKQQAINESRYNEFQDDIKAIINHGQNIGIYKSNLSLEPYIHVLMSCIDGLIMLDTVLDQQINDEIIKTTTEIFIQYIEEK